MELPHLAFGIGLIVCWTMGSVRAMTTANTTNTTSTTNTTTPITTAATTNDGTSHENMPSSLLIMVMGVLAGILILILTILICVFIYRRRHQKKSSQNNGFHDVVSSPDGYNNPQQNSLGNRPGSAISDTDSEGKYNQMSKEPPKDYTLDVSNLEMHIKKIREAESCPFQQEYQEIPEGQTSPWTFGIRKNIHREKNRFGNIVAYDHSRVPLKRKKNDSSEYINADFIDGYKEPKAFIATQGPLPQTVDDFWRMCWEQDVPIIVMVTNCVEGGRQKSEQYWPDVGKTEKVGIYTVHTLKEERFSDFIIRSIDFKQDDEIRKVKHFQFIGWPDHGVPRQATPLLTLRRRVRAEMVTKPGLNGPIVVHCSTFIALDYLQKQAAAEGCIDVFKCVWEMRYQRVSMVQTWDQYQFIYDALLEAVTVGETTIPCYKFEEIYPKWLVPDETTKVTKLEQQLRILGVIKQIQPESELKAALNSENKAKNRREDVLAPNYYRPYLQTRVDGTTDYINAVFVQGYYKREVFLITQAPLPDTRIDFWRMVYDHECHAIINLHNYKRTDAENGEEQIEDKEEENKETDESIPMCWPQRGTMIFGPVIVTFVKTSTDQEGIVMTELTLQIGKKDEDVRQVTLFSVPEFPDDDDAPLPAKCQIALKDAVKRNQQKNEDKTVVVMCKDGVNRCGVYSALDYVIDMMEVEQEVDVFQAVRQVQMPRPQLVSSIEQFKFLYEAAKTYMDINMAYANFQ